MHSDDMLVAFLHIDITTLYMCIHVHHVCAYNVHNDTIMHAYTLIIYTIYTVYRDIMYFVYALCKSTKGDCITDDTPKLYH